MTREALTSDIAPFGFGAHCCRCGRWSPGAVAVRYIERASGPGVTLYACPEHAAELGAGPTLGELEPVM